MPEAIADRQSLAYVEESLYGATPATPAFKKIRHTGESLKQDTNTVDSQEIRDDRQVGDHRRVNVGASGDVNFEFSYGTFDELLEAGLMSSGWSAANDTAFDPASATAGFESIATAAGSYARITDSANGLTAFAAGDVVVITGASNASNNCYAVVMSQDVANAYIEVVPLNDAGDFIDEAAVDIVVGILAYIKNGVTGRSFTLERHYTDIDKYIRDVGMHVNTVQLQFQLEERITGAFGWLGKSEATDDAALPSATYTEAPTNQIMTVVDNVDLIMEGGAKICVTQFSIEINNELRQRQCLGILGASSVGSGKFRCTGNIEMYFEDRTFYDKYLNFNGTDAYLQLSDTDGNKYVITIPNMKISDASANAGGESSDVMVSASWTAVLDANSGNTILIAREPGS